VEGGTKENFSEDNVFRPKFKPKTSHSMLNPRRIRYLEQATMLWILDFINFKKIDFGFGI
jgi:hypothetical protein